MKEVSEWLGHGDITTIYAHVDNQSKRNMANKLEERFKNSEG
jgi:integrase